MFVGVTAAMDPRRLSAGVAGSSDWLLVVSGGDRLGAIGRGVPIGDALTTPGGAVSSVSVRTAARICHRTRLNPAGSARRDRVICNATLLGGCQQEMTPPSTRRCSISVAVAGRKQRRIFSRRLWQTGDARSGWGPSDFL